MESIERLTDILAVYQRIYPQLKDITIRIATVKEDTTCTGKCIMDLDLEDDFEYVGKMRQKRAIPRCIIITASNDMVFTLLHEITHAITPYTERKVKNTWVIIDHSDKFYGNFLLVMDIAARYGFTGKKYELKSLKLRDAR